MWKNLYQRTVYEVKKKLGYNILSDEGMFLVLWDEPELSYFNCAHCNYFSQKELDFINKNIPDTFFSVASNHALEGQLKDIKEGTPSYLMTLKLKEKIAENNQFKIVRVRDEKTLSDFFDVVIDVYDSINEKEALMKFYSKELALDYCYKYIGYINNEPAGTVEFQEGTEALCVSFGAVKKEYRKRGLYRAMFACGINNAIDRGFDTIVLNSSEMGKEVYEKMGFVLSDNRYNYVLDV